jgi:alkylation response protein AidB-like acyl-CoA dehydrogenase
MSESVLLKPIKGGEFVVRQSTPEELFTPEDQTEEQKMIAQMCSDFIMNEVQPNLDRIDHQEEGLMQSLLEKAGELGLLGLSVPEELGGMGTDFTTNLLATESLGAGYSFSVAYGAHTGIGTLPCLYYGSEALRQKYVTKLASGEWKGAYCLTEPSSGSDANSGKTKAILTADGKHYTVNGQKMWITNGGFANVFTVFAKIDGDENLSAFIVDADSPGITLNPEEKKMGIKGSSTRQVFFNDVLVPIENMLAERGQGFKIALNILNIGRIKLAAGVLGGCKESMKDAIIYANTREQFSRPISKYGAIRAKIGEMVIKTYALESATYRVGKNIEDTIASQKAEGVEPSRAYLKGIEEFAAECALLKVAGSEALDYVVDESVQIFGGMGYSAESIVERAYRDARINRIFEGTNEINRMLSVEIILKRAMKGEIDLMGPAMAVAGELMSIPEIEEILDTFLAKESSYIVNFKKALLMVTGTAIQKKMATLSKEQEILMAVSDIANACYLCESSLLRTQKMQAGAKRDLAEKVVKVLFYDAAALIEKSGKDVINNVAEEDELRMMTTGIRRFCKVDAINTIALRNEIAVSAIEKGAYSL